jgi:hypothetical protein
VMFIAQPDIITLPLTLTLSLCYNMVSNFS